MIIQWIYLAQLCPTCQLTPCLRKQEVIVSVPLNTLIIKVDWWQHDDYTMDILSQTLPHLPLYAKLRKLTRDLVRKEPKKTKQKQTKKK